MFATRSDCLSPKERRWIAIFAVAGFLSRIVLAFRGTWQIASRPYLDDAFYLLSCARHLAMGDGFTVDGVHPTNGVQPLICLLYAPGFSIGDLWVGLRLTFVIGALVQAASIVAIAILIGRLRNQYSDVPVWKSSPIIAALVWAISAPLADQNGSGLETGLVALLILCDLIYSHSIRSNGWTLARSLAFGILLGLTVLARVDSALFVVVMILIEWRQAKFLLISAFTALIVSLPWWIYGLVTFGSLMPMSGAAESIGHPIGQNLLQSLTALFDMLTIFFNHAYYAWPPWFEVISFLSIVLAWGVVMKRLRAMEFLKQQYDLRTLAPLAIFSLLLVAFYNFFFSAPHFLVRYLHPVRIGIIILFATVLPLILQRVKQFNGIICKTGIAALAIAVIYFSVYRYVNLFIAPPKSDFYRVGLWARELQGRVGMDQSGTAGFIAPNVINLDGKVNRDALQAVKRNAIGEYIARERIEYLADWKPLVEPLVADAAKYGAHYALYDSIGYLFIYQRLP